MSSLPTNAGSCHSSLCARQNPFANSRKTSSIRQWFLRQLCFHFKKRICTLYVFPPEIRVMIFKDMFNVVGREWNGKVPAIIKALRPENRLYQEALSIFFSPSQAYILKLGNRYCFGDMPQALLATVQHVKIVIPNHYKEEDIYDIGRYYPHNLRSTLSSAVNLHEVTIEVAWGTGERYPHCRRESEGRYAHWPVYQERAITDLLGGQKQLRRVNFSLPITMPLDVILGPVNQWVRQEDHLVRKGGLIAHLNAVMGSVARLTSVPIYPVNADVTRWHSFSCDQPLWDDEYASSYPEYFRTRFILRASLSPVIQLNPWRPLRMETYFWEAEAGKFLNTVP